MERSCWDEERGRGGYGAGRETLFCTCSTMGLFLVQGERDAGHGPVICMLPGNSRAGLFSGASVRCSCQASFPTVQRSIWELPNSIYPAISLFIYSPIQQSICLAMTCLRDGNWSCDPPWVSLACENQMLGLISFPENVRIKCFTLFQKKKKGVRVE